MAAGAAEILLQCLFHGSISMHDLEIQRRPYHRGCKCALHKLDSLCPNACYSLHRTISFPKKQAWTDCSLSIVASFSYFSLQ
ncbi:hypothetical protein JCGZ_03970 [Jatropha curcas]|uniref:Uncharacterized protein n=1 Tax=Jatropha curcas TaxID=180498 RepID=A0A067KR46_JATCU|nr:hypothetical protein JCGZ_03970 [Jatropha curcas]